MLIDDHSANSISAQALAQQLGMKAPTGAGIKHQVTYARFKVPSGTGFDRQFAKHMIQDHKPDQRVWGADANRKETGRQLRWETLPDLKKHLQMAQSPQTHAATKGCVGRMVTCEGECPVAIVDTGLSKALLMGPTPVLPACNHWCATFTHAAAAPLRNCPAAAPRARQFHKRDDAAASRRSFGRSAKAAPGKPEA